MVAMPAGRLVVLARVLETTLGELAGGLQAGADFRPDEARPVAA